MKLRANVRPQWQWAKLKQISGITSKNGKNDAK